MRGKKLRGICTHIVKTLVIPPKTLLWLNLVRHTLIIIFLITAGSATFHTPLLISSTRRELSATLSVSVQQWGQFSASVGIRAFRPIPITISACIIIDHTWCLSWVGGTSSLVHTAHSISYTLRWDSLALSSSGKLVDCAPSEKGAGAIRIGAS